MKKINLLFASALTLLSLTACGQQEASSSKEEQIIIGSQKETQLVFEEKYVEEKFPYSSGAKFVVSLVGNIGAICAGSLYNNPVSIVSGIFGTISTFGNTFITSKAPTTQDIMDKLAEMNTKLDEINATLNENHNQLLNENVRTQALVDKVLLEDQESAISNFYTTYVMPLENHQRDFSDYLEQSLKTFTSTAQSVSFYIHKNADKQWAFNSLLDVESAKELEVTISIDKFEHTAEFLEKNFNTVTEGFMDNLYRDLEIGVAAETLPQGLDAKTAVDFLAGSIIESITKKYYVDNHDKALSLRNDVINYSKAISGKAVKSVVDRYIARLKYMYNFEGEIKNTLTDLLSNLKQNLKSFASLASQACAYASVNQDEIRAEFIAAEDAIRTKYNAEKAIKDNYCFLTEKYMGSGFYRARFATSYKNKGNDCTFNAEFNLEKIVSWSGASATKDDITKHNFIESVDHLRIVSRMGLMKQLGLIDPSASYIEYLVNANIVSEDDYENFKYLRNDKWISSDALRFITNLTTRSMSDGDKGLIMTCNEAGNPDGDYFNVGWTGKFRSSRTSSCWSGTIAETTFVDAITGEIQSDKKVAAYATYAESHWNWINDEFWSFVDNPAGNYFFGLESLTE